MKLLSVTDLEEKLAAGENLVLIDVREPHELAHGQLASSQHMPLDELPDRLSELDKTQDTVFICRSGGRSQAAAEMAESEGFTSTYNLVGGMNAWASIIDQTMTVY